MSDTFGVADGGVEGINQWFVEEFRRRGYTFTDETTERARFGGFIDPKTGPVGRGGYCAGSDLLNIDVLPIDRRSVEYRVRVTQSHQNCSGRMHGRPPAFADPPEFPVLLNPAGTTQTYAMFNNNCGEREFGGSSTGVLLTTSMSPADLIKHYDRQMAAAGWKQTPVPSTATSTWTKPDAAGEDVVITLTASAGRLTPNCRFVQLATTRPPGRIK
jgi:hypothetical protein